MQQYAGTLFARLLADDDTAVSNYTPGNPAIYSLIQRSQGSATWVGASYSYLPTNGRRFPYGDFPVESDYMLT